ncbi:hypothetical protein K6L59_03090, partial [Candidatus Phytoplasma sp. Tabriz.2]|nr:hypothetical protein [Candidatus Phytoplasma australiense]
NCIQNTSTIGLMSNTIILINHSICVISNIYIYIYIYIYLNIFNYVKLQILLLRHVLTFQTHHSTLRMIRKSNTPIYT